MTDMCNNTEPLKKAQKYLSTKMNSKGAQSRGWAESALLLMRRLAGRGRGSTQLLLED